MIRKARRIPIECEFMEYTGDNRDEVVEWLGLFYQPSPIKDDPLIYITYGYDGDYIIAGIGDYIVADTDLNGTIQITPMDKETFENHYMEELKKCKDWIEKHMGD